MKKLLQKVIKNNWYREPGKPFASAKILSHDTHPEGLDVERVRFFGAGNLIPKQSVGHIISVIKGNAYLHLASDKKQNFHLEAGCHLYLPPGLESNIDAGPDTEFLHVASANASQARGTDLLLRDEQFLSACASGNQSLRWVLTSQFLSRRIFLHHDQVLVSKSGNPVSWFRTTMFDVVGLPPNEDGEPVFKMSYNSKTEFNVCYDVRGTARVRMALHPYKRQGQRWGRWLTLDNDSTYHLNEVAGGPEEECYMDDTTHSPKHLRNKHEVFIEDGYVTLFCLFDPAPAGFEHHQPGEYSDYVPLSEIQDTPLYETFQREITKYDAMVDQLSLAKATGELSSYYGTSIWDMYIKGQEAQCTIESELANALIAEGDGREKVLAKWMRPSVDKSGITHN